MPHYKDGTEAKIGDHVKTKDYNGKEIVGVITTIHPGSDTCNAGLTHVVMAPQVTTNTAVNIKDMELLHRPT